MRYQGRKFHSTFSKQADQSVCRLCTVLFEFPSTETTRTHRHPLSPFQEYSQSSCTEGLLWWLIWTLKSYPKHYWFCSMSTINITACSWSSANKGNVAVQHIRYCLHPNNSSQPDQWMDVYWMCDLSLGSLLLFNAIYAAVKRHTQSREPCCQKLQRGVILLLHEWYEIILLGTYPYRTDVLIYDYACTICLYCHW